MLKKYFIPHKGNNHQPHILRKRTVLAVLITLLLIEAAFLVQILLVWPLTGIFSSILPGVLADLANVSRAQNNVAPLKVNPLLEQAAQLKAQDMVAKGYFDHTSPEGITPWYWLAKVGYRYSGAGENLAINFSDSADIENAWMNSPGHRANILDNRFTEIGIAAVKGMYQGRETVFVVQFFGRPQAQTTAASATVPAKSSPSAKTPLPNKTQITPEVSAPPVASASVAPQAMVVDNQPQASNASGTVSGVVDSAAINQATSNSPLWQQLISMPKKVTAAIYLAIAAVFGAALALKIFVKIKIQYPKLIFNGVIVLFVAISLLYLNYLIIGQGKIFN